MAQPALSGSLAAEDAAISNQIPSAASGLGMRKLSTGVLCALLTVGTASAEETQAFSAVSIRANKSGAPNSETDTAPGRVSLINVTPLSLLLRAFGVQEFQLVGVPKWATQERYDVLPATFDAVTAYIAERARPRT